MDFRDAGGINHVATSGHGLFPSARFIAIFRARRRRRGRIFLFLACLAVSVLAHVAAFLVFGRAFPAAPLPPFILAGGDEYGLDMTVGSAYFLPRAPMSPETAPGERRVETPDDMPSAFARPANAETAAPDKADLAGAPMPSGRERLEETPGFAAPARSAPVPPRAGALPPLAERAAPPPPSGAPARRFDPEPGETRFDAAAAAELSADAGREGGLPLPSAAADLAPEAINPQPALTSGDGPVSTLIARRSSRPRPMPSAALREPETPSSPPPPSPEALARGPGNAPTTAKGAGEMTDAAAERRFSDPGFPPAGVFGILFPKDDAGYPLFFPPPDRTRLSPAAADAPPDEASPDMADGSELRGAAPSPIFELSASRPDAVPAKRRAGATSPPPAAAPGVLSPGRRPPMAAKRRPAEPLGGIASFFPSLIRPGGRIRLSVRIWVKVNERGVCETAEIRRTSGYPILDQRILEAARRAIYRPAIAGGLPVTWSGEFDVPIY